MSVIIGEGQLSGGSSGNVITVSSNTVDPSQGDVFVKNITQNTTLSFSSAGQFLLGLKNSKGYTVNLPSNMTWTDDTEPSLKNDLSLIEFASVDGSNWYGRTYYEYKQKITSRGCTLYRASGGVSTIIEYTKADGTTSGKLEVIDAAYRKTGLKFGTYGTNTSLTNFSSVNANNTWYIDGGNSSLATNYKQTSLPDTITNSLLCTQWANLATDKTAKENCDVWMTYNSQTDTQSTVGVPAVAYARGLSYDGGGWQVPNEFQLMIIFMLADEIDSLDPTASANPTLMLGKDSQYGRFYFNNSGGSYAWSSTECDGGGVRGVGYAGSCDYGGKSNAYVVVPAREPAA